MSEITLTKKRTGRVMLVSLGLLVLLGFMGFQLMVQQYAAVDPGDKTYVDIIIPEGSSAADISEILYQNNLIHNEKAFLAYLRHKGCDGSLQVGHYRLSRSQSTEEIVSDLMKGRVVNISFTIPEGYTVDQIGELLENREICSKEQWQAAISKPYDYDFLEQSAAAGGARLEGFLFPDTYSVTDDSTAEQVVAMMLNRFQEVWQANFASQARQEGKNVYDTVIIASMIEREAMVASERPVIAGVIYNRLKQGMLLQIDATVLYCLNEDKEVVQYADLEVDSPYNTYIYPGLPPGPIACPGKASLEAALNPQKHSYYYYVARGDGSHEFSRTYNEHLAAKRKYIN